MASIAPLSASLNWHFAVILRFAGLCTVCFGGFSNSEHAALQ
jgi:hypothetical protein